MMKPVIITGLDISSSKVSAVAAQLSVSGDLEIIAFDSQPSSGISRGVFSDITEASNSVTKVLTKLGEKTGKKPCNIYANISGESIRGERSKGMIPLSSRGREVTNADIVRCVNAASTIRLTFDREIIHRVVLSFSIDDQPSIKNALGLYASRLYCEMYIITANLNHIQNIYKCVNNAGYDLKEVIYSGIADGESLVEDICKEEGSALINIGASLTELSIFSGGAINFIDVICAGASDIKSDLRQDQNFNNLIARVKEKIEEFVKRTEAIRSVIITGGLSLSEGTAEIIEEHIGYPVKMGVTRNIHGHISSTDSLRAATAIGLAKYASAQYQPRSTQAKSLVHNISNKVVELFNNYF